MRASGTSASREHHVRSSNGPATTARALRAAFLGLLPLLLLGCQGVVLLDPKGRIGAEEKSLILTAAVLMLIVIVPVIVMAIAFAWRYRASNRRARYSPEWSHSRVLEATIWVVPILIVSVLGYLAWTRSHSLDPFRPLASSVPPVRIQVVSLDWKWLFIYPDEHVAAVNEVAFPVNTPVDFFVTADTVMNSFFIPQLGSQIYTMAGMQTQVHLVANHEGDYAGISANFSGPGFSGMTFTARALSDGGYQAWLARARGSAAALDAASYARLQRPSEYVPVQYFSSVQPRLFDTIVRQYMGMHPRTVRPAPEMKE